MLLLADSFLVTGHLDPKMQIKSKWTTQNFTHGDTPDDTGLIDDASVQECVFHTHHDVCGDPVIGGLVDVRSGGVRVVASWRWSSRSHWTVPYRTGTRTGLKITWSTIQLNTVCAANYCEKKLYCSKLIHQICFSVLTVERHQKSAYKHGHVTSDLPQERHSMSTDCKLTLEYFVIYAL